MDSSDQRRKRKRSIIRQSCSFSCVRSLIMCSILLSFVYLLSYTSSLTSSASPPVLLASSFSLLSYSSSRKVKSVQSVITWPLKVEDRVLFPDHVLLLLRKKGSIGDLECVYNGVNGGFVKQKMVSFDEYDDFRTIVRCPLPMVNYSAAVNLNWGSKNLITGEKKDGFRGNFIGTVNSWENVVYSAVLDGDTVVVFVKGLNLRPDRESDPSQFSCQFKLGNWERKERFMITRALSAAQEVVRCSLPRILGKHHETARGMLVTVGYRSHVRARGHEHVLMPSVARVSNPAGDGGKKRCEAGKYGLCVCTMVWNQARAVQEWITYHSWLGVERFFIYDNNSDDGIDEVVEELDTKGYNVTRHVWPWIKAQEAGFSHCALRARDECDWVSFMDVDEYFYFPNSTSKHQEYRNLGYAPQNSLRALVANFSSGPIGEMRTSCHSFGPSGLNSPPLKGVTVGYTCRLQSPERHKSIIRPDALDTSLLNVVHHFHLRKGFEYINLPQSTAIINHYKYQVWDVFRTKFYRRVATYVVDWQENQNEGSRDRAPGLGTEAIEPPDWAQRFCEVWDTDLRDFVLANLADVSTGLLPWERESTF